MSKRLEAAMEVYRYFAALPRRKRLAMAWKILICGQAVRNGNP
jgi:hypothetical protein